jgi:putative endonuclease
MPKGGYVYMMANRPNGILYVGCTSNLPQRVEQHKTGAFEGFTKKYGLKTLVWYEPFDTIEGAIARERQLKEWKRAWKVRLILESNELWEDLTPELV